MVTAVPGIRSLKARMERLLFIVDFLQGRNLFVQSQDLEVVLPDALFHAGKADLSQGVRLKEADMKKQITALLLGLSLAVPLGLSAFAEEPSPEKDAPDSQESAVAGNALPRAAISRLQTMRTYSGFRLRRRERSIRSQRPSSSRWPGRVGSSF